MACIYQHTDGKWYSKEELRNKLFSEQNKPSFKDVVDAMKLKHESVINENIPDEFSDEDNRTTGISQESLSKTASKLGSEAPERGEGISPEEGVSRGRELLSKGEDPNKILDEFKKDNKISADAVALVRAQHEKLMKDVYSAADKYGISSEQYKIAKDEALKWAKDVVKPMATEWHKVGQTFQGETDIDTGSFVGLNIAFQEAYGHDFSSKQAKEATILSDKVKKMSDEYEKTIKELTDKIDKLVKDNPQGTKNIKENAKRIANVIRQGKLSRPGVFSSATPASLVWDTAIEITAKSIEAGGTIAQAIADGLEHIRNSEWYKSSDKKEEAEKTFADYINDKSEKKDLFNQFVDKKDSKFTPEEVRDIWNYAKKEYLDKGMPYKDMLSGVSKDLSLTPEQVRRAITQPKGARIIEDELYIKQRNRARAIQNAKDWIETTDTPRALRFIKALPSFFFGLKVFGHGTVGMITHSGSNIFKPTSWNTYWPNFFRQFKYAFGPTAAYEKAMENLTLRPDFNFWRRAGLACDPVKVYDDYQGFSKYMGKYFGRITETGDRGFNALKVYRIDLAKSIYEGLSQVERSDPNTAKEIAKIVNHSTGSANVIVPKSLGVAFFAPRLEASRWARLVV
jgi:hypothetical protein